MIKKGEYIGSFYYDISGSDDFPNVSGVKQVFKDDLLKVKFSGSHYDPKRDKLRLTKGLNKIYHALLLTDSWLTVPELSALTKLQNQSSVSAQIRNLRKSPYFFNVERRWRWRGLSEYKLIKGEHHG